MEKPFFQKIRARLASPRHADLTKTLAVSDAHLITRIDWINRLTSPPSRQPDQGIREAALAIFSATAAHSPVVYGGLMADVDYQPVLTGLPVDGFVRTGSDSDWVLKDVETPSHITAEPDHALKGRGYTRKAS